MDSDFTGRRNQEDGKYPGSVLHRTRNIIKYSNCFIKRTGQLQTEILLSTTDAEYIALLQARRDVLLFVNHTKEIVFVIEIQGDTPNVMCSIFGIHKHFTKIFKRCYHSNLLRKHDLTPITW